MLQTFKVHFVLKVEKTNQKGLAPIFARIRLNGTKMEISTNRVIYPDNWSPENEAAHPLTKANKELNQYLETFKGKVYSGYSTLLGSGQDLSSELLRHAIFGNPLKKRYNLIEVAKEHNEQFERLIGRKYSYGSFKNYKTTLKYLIEFIPIEYKRLDIPLEKADYKFCEKFFGYLTSIKSCKTNGANKQIQRVKKIINFAIRSGYIQTNLTAAFSLHFTPVRKIALTQEEINIITKLPLQRDTLRLVRDAFIFQCYTGLSYSDIKGLKKGHIYTDAKQSLWIKMERQKTKVAFSVPLLKIAADLLKKYQLAKVDKEFIFPILSNQKMNDNLKIIQEIAGINKNLTTHLARHSFATTITLNNDVPIETVSKMLGHTNIRTTQAYAKVLDTKIGVDMAKLKDKFS